MKTKADYDWCAHPGVLENVKTGQSFPNSNPLAEGLRRLLAAGDESICIEGTDAVSSVQTKCYMPDVGIGEDSNNGKEVSLAGVTWPKELIIGGLDEGSALGGVFLTQRSGVPGPLRFESLKAFARGVSMYCIESGQKFPKPYGGVTAVDVECLAFDPTVLGDKPAKFGFRLDCHDYVRLEGITGFGFQDYLAYCDNSQEDSWIRKSMATNCGRGLCQWSNREFTDPENTERTNNPSTPETATLTLQNNLAIDCSSYVDPDDGSIHANGSAFAVQDFCGDVNLLGNTVLQTRAGGGGCFIGHDAKAGSFKRADGFRIGIVRAQRNQFIGVAGAHASRDMEMFGAMKRLELGPNQFGGNLPCVLLDHTGKIAEVVALIPNLSAKRYWGTGAKIRRVVQGTSKTVTLSDQQIDALYVLA